jgi:cell division protease FtsH
VNFSRNAALWIIVILLLFALFNLFQGSAMRGAQEELKYSEFVTKAEKGEVSEVTIQGQKITGEYANGRSFQTMVPEETDVAAMLLAAGVEIDVSPAEEVNPLLSILISWSPCCC